MFKKNQKAINALNVLLIDLEKVSNAKQGNSWKARLKDTLKLYLDPDSALITRVDKLYFTRNEQQVVEGVIGIFDNYIYDESKKVDFRVLIENAISQIKSNGVFKGRNRNFLGGFGNVEIISAIAFSVILIFNIGSYFGKQDSKDEVNEIQNKYKETLKEKEEIQSSNLKLLERLNSVGDDLKKTHGTPDSLK